MQNPKVFKFVQQRHRIGSDIRCGAARSQGGCGIIHGKEAGERRATRGLRPPSSGHGNMAFIPIHCEDNDRGITAASQGKAPDCADVVSGCLHPSIGALVRKYCPRTCELCHSCTDDDKGVAAASKGHAPNCAATVRGCSDPSIGALVRKYCPHTCNLCPSSAAAKSAPQTMHTMSHLNPNTSELQTPFAIAMVAIPVGIILAIIIVPTTLYCHRVQLGSNRSNMRPGLR